MFERVLDLLERLLKFFAGRFTDGLLVFFQQLLGFVNALITTVANLHLLTRGLVLLGMSLGILLHFVDFFLAQATGRRDGDFLFLAGAQVFGADMKDPVGINVESHFDLGDATGRRRNLGQVKSPDRLVITRHLAFPLENMNLHACLAVSRRGKNLTFTGGDGCVALDQPCEHAAQCFDPERQGSDIKQDDILFDLATENSGLDRRAHRHHFVGINSLVRGFTNQRVRRFDYLGHARHTANQYQFIDLAHLHLGVAQAIFHRPDGTLDQVITELFQLGA